MSDWPLIVVPAVVAALIVRLDAKMIGPYFALSELIAGSDSVDAQVWYESVTLRWAVVRRFAYALLMGLVLAAASSIPLWEIAVVGALTAGLLVWPVVFHGLPFGVSRRDWEVPVLYVSFVAAYGALTVSGALVWSFILYASDGDVAGWATEQFVSSLLLWIAAAFAAGIYRVSFGRLQRKASVRESIGREYDWKGNSSMLDSPPPDSP